MTGSRRGRRGGHPGRQREAKIPGALETFCRLLLEAVRNDPPELRRNLRGGRRGHRILLQHRQHRLGRALRMERPTAGQHLVEDRAESEEVGAMVDFAAPDLLRRHVTRRAEDDARLRAHGRRLRELHVRRRAGREHRQAEVEDLDEAAVRQKDVVRLEVAMHDAAVVRGREAFRDLERVLDGLARRNRGRREPRPKRLPLEKLHDGVDGAAVLADVVDGEDVRVRERRHRLHFAVEPGDRVRTAARERREHLDRHVPAQAGVPGPIDLAHASRPERPENFVRPESDSGWNRHVRSLGRGCACDFPSLVGRPAQRAAENPSQSHDPEAYTGGISRRGTSHDPKTRRTWRP